MRIFKNKPFTRFMRKCDLTDAELCEAIRSVERCLIDADLGGGVIKQRIARKGSGKSGGFRTMILFKAGQRSIFVHGYAKNERENIRLDELVALKKLALSLLAYDENALAAAITQGTLIEVRCNGDKEAIS
jgi:hypothetical protein